MAPLGGQICCHNKIYLDVNYWRQIRHDVYDTPAIAHVTYIHASGHIWQNPTADVLTITPPRLGVLSFHYFSY